MPCPNCGGTLIGDGVTMVLHCENVNLDALDCRPEPDADPVYCCEKCYGAGGWEGGAGWYVCDHCGGEVAQLKARISDLETRLKAAGEYICKDCLLRVDPPETKGDF